MTLTLPPMAEDKSPLFIIGSMRSGTTWARNMLRRVPKFICPEETHFMRWSEPFRSPGGMHAHHHNKVLKMHRELDGVDQDIFDLMLQRSPSKAHLHRSYIGAFAAAHGVEPPYRWFDKTPQNVYGLPLILAEFPRARILHLVRNPLNVVASLQLGKQVNIPDLDGAINCWLESVKIWDAIAPRYKRRTMEIRYEDILVDPNTGFSAITTFAGVEHPAALWSKKDASPEKNAWKSVLSDTAASLVVRRCEGVAASRGYDLSATLDAFRAGNAA